MSRLIRRGFTLSELLIVIAVIGILSSMMMVASSNSVRTSRADTVINTLRNFSAAAMTFYTDSMDHFTRNPNYNTDIDGTTQGLKERVKKYMYSEGSTIQNEENYTVWNDSGTWWAGYDLTKDNDKDGIKERLTNRAKSAGLVGSTGITSYPAKTSNKYPVYDGNNAVWLLIRTNSR